MSSTELVKNQDKIKLLSADLKDEIIAYVQGLTSTGVQPGKPPRPRRYELEIVARLTYGIFEINEGIKAFDYPEG